MHYVYLLLLIFLYFPINILNKLTSSETTSKESLVKITLFRAFIGVILGGALLIINKTPLVFSVNAIGPAVFFGAMLAFGLLCVFYSLQVTTVAISNIFMTSSLIISGAFGVLFLGDKLTIGKVAGTLILLFAMYLIVSNKSEEKKKFGLKAFLVCMGVLLTNGFGTIAILLFANGAPEVPESVFMFVSYIVDFVILSVFYLILRCKGSKSEPTKFDKKFLILGSLGAVALFLNQQFATAISGIIPTTILAPLNMGSNVFISVLVGLILFKEKLSIKNIIGIVIAFLSLIMINSL